MIDYEKIAAAIAKYSPLVASGISEMNPVLGTVLMAITRAFNTDIPSLPSVITADPDALSKIKSIEDQYHDDLIKYQVQDREDARNRELKLVQLTGKRDWVLDVIAFIVILGFFVMCTTVEFTHMDSSDH